MARRHGWALALWVSVTCGLGLPGVAQARKPAVYHTPGYAGSRHLPHVAPVPPPPPVPLSDYGHSAHVLVDAAGTAHIAWSEDRPQTPGVMHYCRLPRGASACATTYTRPILQPATGGNGPATDVDFDGPFPLAVGNQLVLADSRCCNEANAPDGKTTSNPVYLFTSEDGGNSFTGPDDPNGTSGIIGNQDPSGGTLAFNGNDPMIGTISDTQTGGTIFQGVPAGQFTREKANLSVRANQDDAYDGRLAIDGIRPVASFDDLDGMTVVREWSGQGSVNDPANWSVLRIPGAYRSRIAGGPSGLFLLSHTGLVGGTLQVRRISPGATSAGPPMSLGAANGDFAEIAQSSTGRLAVARFAGDDGGATVLVRTSPDGVHWTDLGVVARVRGGELRDLSLGVGADGGGFLTFRDIHGAPTTFAGRVEAVQFGPTGPTGQPGLGLLPGHAGPPDGNQGAFVACTKVHFGSVDALAKAGCFLRDPAHPASGAAVTSGAIRLNGLDLVPDAGVKIGIDPRDGSLNTTGAVSVTVDGGDLGSITLWHGELHVKVGPGAAGTTLFDLDTSQFAAALEGFPLSGRIQVILGPDSVQMPIHVSLPPYFGGINGDALLRADNTSGLILDSLHLGIADANVGALELKNVHLDYTRAGSVWDGGAEVLLPGPLSPDITANVRFEGGSFKYGQLEVSFKPGILVFSDVYIHDFLLGFGLHPTVFTGGISVGLYDGIGSYPLDVIGRVKVQIGDDTHPTVFFIGGTGQVLGFDLAHASFTYNSDGYVLFHIDAGVDIGVASFHASGDVFVLHGAFGANLSVDGCVFKVCVGFDGAASPKGLAVCSGSVGATMPDWDPSQIDFHLLHCHVGPYQLQAPPAGAARAASAERTVTVPRGQPVLDLKLSGVGGAPDVMLVAPDGKAVGLQPPATRGATAVIGRLPARGLTWVGVRNPAPGVWTVRTLPGSAPIATLASAYDRPLPVVRASVSGSGAVRVLRYTIRRRVPGTVVQFAESGREGMVALGTGSGSGGVLRFRPAPGTGGPRAIVAVIVQDGLTQAQPVVARYIAPAIRRPGRVGGLGLIRRGGVLRVVFAGAPGAVRYAVRVIATGGLDAQRTVDGTSLTLRGLRPGAALVVTVRGLNARGVAGPASLARIPASRR